MLTFSLAPSVSPSQKILLSPIWRTLSFALAIVINMLVLTCYTTDGSPISGTASCSDKLLNFPVGECRKECVA